MKNYAKYDEELKDIVVGLKKTFKGKDNIINEFKIRHYINRIVRLNSKTKNAKIDELMCLIGETKIQYKKFCNRNDYYTNPSMNNAFKEAFIKLSKKSIRIKTKRSVVKRNGTDLKIEYNSNRGSYKITRRQKDGTEKVKYYSIKNIKNLERKRIRVMEELKQLNYGINVFDELDVDDRKIYKLNPDIIHILINEGKTDYAKMYIKDVLDGTTVVYKPFEIKYELDRNVSRGVFSREENKNMKKMALHDAVASRLIIFSTKKKKEIDTTRAGIIQKIANIMDKKSKVKAEEYVFDSTKVQKIMEMKKRIQPEILPEQAKIDESKPVITKTKRENESTIKNTSKRIIKVDYEREVV